MIADCSGSRPRSNACLQGEPQSCGRRADVLVPRQRQLYPDASIGRRDNPEGTMRSSITWSVLVLSVSIASTQTAGAQDAKRLFFEADMVRHALEGQAGPFCVLTNQ